MFGFGAFSEFPFSALRETRINFYGGSEISINFEYRIYAATREFVTEDGQPFLGTLDQPLSFSRSILGTDLIGRFTSGSGEIDITNADARYDFLIEGYAIDGRDITVKVGVEGADYSTFFTIFKGPATDWSVEESLVRIDIQDNSYKLNVPVQPNTYAGSGGIDGGDDLKGKKKPLSFGYVQNIAPPLVKASSLLYQVHDGAVQAISAVYNRGVAVTQGSDYATSTLLLAASVPSGYYATCLAEGFFRVNFVLDGTITADVEGDADPAFVSSAADIVRRIIDRATDFADADIYQPNIDLVNAIQTAQLGYYVGPDQETTIADVFSDIMASVGGWAGFRRDGKFEVNIYVGAAETPAAYYDRIDERDVKRGKPPSALSPPSAKFRVGWSKNWSVQTDLAGSVSESRKAFLAEEYRYATAESASIRADHPFTKDPAPIRGYFRNESDALAEAQRLLDLYGQTSAIYTVDLGTEPFTLNLGDTVNIKYPRWDLTVGRNGAVVSITENAANNACTIGVHA